MLFELDRDTKVPLYVQIRHKVRELILSGALPAESRLPATRELAKALGVNRTTVVTAYRGLWREGLVQGRAGGGTVVALPGRKREAPHPIDQPLLWDDLYTERVPALFPWTSAPRLPADEEPLDFARGDPATDLLPLDSMWEGLSEVKRQGHAPLRYAPPQGDPELRARLAESLELRGMRASPSQILVLSGGGQGIYLAAQAFLERGDGVVVESPTHPEALRIFRAVGAQLRPVPLDEGGLRLDVLEETLSRLRPKLIYVTPTFHNPTGITMPTERRERLLELACRYRVPILEDDPFPGLCYDGESVPPLAALDRQGTVLHLSTLSKVFAPGLRIGWLLAPRPVAERLTLLKSSIDLCTSPLSQAVATALFPRRLSRHLETIVPIYRSRRDTLCAALVREGANALRFSRPAGGLFLWATLAHDLLAEPLLEEALAEGVSFLPGAPFFPWGYGGERALRLNFAAHPKATIEEGMRRLGSALRRTARRARQGRRECEREEAREEAFV